MNRCCRIVLVGLLAGAVGASEVILDKENDQRCSGMYSKASWGGAIDPYIEIKFNKVDEGQPIASLIIYEYKDHALIGRPNPNPMNEDDNTLWLCDAIPISLNMCNSTQAGQYLLAANATTRAKSNIITTAVHLNEPETVKYPIKNTGYYCIATNTGSGGPDYKATVGFRNAYGELAAAQIAKLPFYGGMTLVYAVIGIFWGFLYAQNRHDILPVQNYITAIIVFLVVEMLITWGYYDFENVHGATMGAKAFLIVVAILNAGRNAFSFFLLLIVCMGYGVVKPTLGKTMLYVRGLAAIHFAFCLIYTIASMVIRPEEAGAIVLLVILPLSSTLTAFYIWTLNSLNMTMKDLIDRKQHVKATMYRRLWYCILVTIVVIFGFFFFNSFAFTEVGNADFAPSNWQTRWFILDGWLNLVYLADVAYISYLWRPTPNNRRFAMSDELAQDDEGFEINSIVDSLDGSDVEDNAGKYNHTPPDSAPSSTEGRFGPAPSNIHRSVSPLPAPTPQRPSSLTRHSLDGETIFAVGDEDKFSDESDEEERSGLVKKSS